MAVIAITLMTKDPSSFFDSRPVAVVTCLGDVTADLVITELHQRKVPVVRFDLGDLPEHLSVSARLGRSQFRGILTTDTRTLPFDGVRSLYYRRPTLPAYSTLSNQNARFATAQVRAGLRGILDNLPDCFYVNHPAAIATAEFKAAQLRVADELGMLVPDTLITNSLDDARAFAAEHSEVIYKPLHATDYERAGEPVTIWTRTVTSDELDVRVAVTLHLFQEKVNKVADWRVTVIGGEVFCVQIEHPDAALDWRYDYEALTYSVVEPPERLVRQLHAFLDRFGLVFGCFDFGLTSSGEPVFFECNPNGQWAWIESVTGLPMTAAFADLLQKGV